MYSDGIVSRQLGIDGGSLEEERGSEQERYTGTGVPESSKKKRGPPRTLEGERRVKEDTNGSGSWQGLQIGW